MKDKKREPKVASKLTSLPWIEKYRPASLAHMSYQEEVVDALRGVL